MTILSENIILNTYESIGERIYILAYVISFIHDFPCNFKI